MYALSAAISLGHSSIEEPLRMKLCFVYQFRGKHPGKTHKNLTGCYEIVIV
jgi:hypothetical protein